MGLSIRLSDAELHVLSGLPHSVCWLYVKIRTRMDYATGLVGAVPGARISWRALMEEMYVDPHQGVTGSGTPPKAKVRRWVQWLIKAGALQLVNDTDGYLVFFCALAVSDKSAQNKPGTNPARGETVKPGTLEPSGDAGLQDKPGTNPARGETVKPGTHPVSGNNRTVPYHAHVDSDVPTHQAEWATFMVDARGFAFHLVQSVPVVKMFIDWVKRGVSVGDVQIAMTAAEATLRRVPDTPAFYRNFVEQVMQEKTRTSTGGGYAQRGGGDGRRGRLSAAEQAAEDERRLDECGDDLDVVAG